jgi:hypothetical protein
VGSVVYPFTQDDLNNYVANAICCASNLGDVALNLKRIGDVTYQQREAELMLLICSVEALNGINLSTQNCFCPEDFEFIFENINSICCKCC